MPIIIHLLYYYLALENTKPQDCELNVYATLGIAHADLWSAVLLLL